MKTLISEILKTLDAGLDAEPQEIGSSIHTNEECDVQWTIDGKLVWKRSLERGQDAIICSMCLCKIPRDMTPDDAEFHL